MGAYILVFDKSKAPNNAKDFTNWFEEKSKWQENRNYSSIEGTSKNLTNFFSELIKYFPNDDEEYFIDYTIGSDLIYMNCEFSIAEQYYKKVEELCYKYNLGYSDLEKIYWDKNNITKFELSYNQMKNKPLKVVVSLLRIVTDVGFLIFAFSSIAYLITSVKYNFIDINNIYLYIFLIALFIVVFSDTIANYIDKKIK